MKYLYKYYNGFFLIELLIAIAILAIFSLLIAQFHWKIIENKQNSDNYRKALNLANSLIDEISVCKTYKSPIYSEKFTVFIQPIETEKKEKQQKGNEQPILKRLQFNKITISWHDITKIERKISLVFGIII